MSGKSLRLFGDARVNRINAVAEMLYLALRAMPCRCEMEWRKGKQEITKICSRCTATEQYLIVREAPQK